MGQLASTLNKIEKMIIEKLKLQFLNQHSYFSWMWKMLSDTQKRQVLDIIVCVKGVIPCEKINSIVWALNLKVDFCVCVCTLKGKAVSDEEYENSKNL